jgi:hypothetical protein
MIKGYCMVKIEDGGKNLDAIKRGLSGSRICASKFFITYNVPTLGEGGDFNHKYQCGKRMLNLAVNVYRRTVPPLLPNVC